MLLPAEPTPPRDRRHAETGHLEQLAGRLDPQARDGLGGRGARGPRVDAMEGARAHPRLRSEVLDPEVVGEIRDALLGFLHAQITITVLSVNTLTGQYRFGVTMAMEPPINILNVIALNSIGIEISAGAQTGSPSTSP